MPYRLIGSNGAGTASADAAVSTTAFSSVGANLLVCATCNNGANPAAALSDSAGNTWIPLTRRTGGGAASQIFYVFNPTTSAAHVATIAATASNLASLCLWAFSGAAASPFDQENGAASGSPGSITTTGDDELIICCAGDQTSGGPGVIASNYYPFVNSFWIPVVGGNRFAFGASFMYQRLAGVINLTISVASTPTSAIASFKAAAVAGGGAAGGAWGHA